MESVEEMCDTIALIDNSNKILEGKLIDIKEEYKNNRFEIGLLCDDKELLFDRMDYVSDDYKF